MFKHIMVPVDLRMPPEVVRAVDVAKDIAKWQNARVTLVSVTGWAGSGAPNTTRTIAAALDALADDVKQATGGEVETHNIHSVDVAAETDADLARAVTETGADLVVTGSHAPRLSDYIFSSHSGQLAVHAPVSVLVVR